ncbi:MAG: hypothetical protein HZB38_16130 [Planctomycetes bacterium]|nr:hypothetical protein [Planctomycetota bacterium]
MNQSSANAVGVVAAGLLLGGAFLAPRLFSTPTVGSNPAAQRAAEEARRDLLAYEESLPRFITRVNLEELKAADADKLAGHVKDELEAAGREFSEAIERARKTDRASGLPQISVAPLSGDAMALRSAIASIEKLESENAGQLKQAVSKAQSAMSEGGGSAIGVGQVAGMANLMEAHALLAQARRTRTLLNNERAAAMAAAGQWVLTRSQLDHFKGLDTKQADETLAADGAELNAQLAVATKELEDLNARIAKQKETLAGVRTGLAEARDAMTQAEMAGFKAGDDASFATMKAAIEGASKRMVELQAQEHLLVFGGIEGAKLTDDELLTGAIKGGEAVLGLEELERRQSLAADRVSRLTRGGQALAKQAEQVAAFAKNAADESKRYDAQLAAQRTAAQKILDRMTELNQSAAEQEANALSAANNARAAFAQGTLATKTVISEADTLRRSADPESRNDRLKQIVNDSFSTTLPELGEAQAHAMIGRIHAERAAGVESYLGMLKKLTGLIKGGSIEKEDEFKKQIDTDRGEARNALADAKEKYEKLGTHDKIGWMSQVALAAVATDAAKVDPDKAAQYKADADKAIRAAVDKAGKSWVFDINAAVLKTLLAPGEGNTKAETKPAEEGSQPAETPANGG